MCIHKEEKKTQLISERILQFIMLENNSKQKLAFKAVNENQRSLILKWLAQDHIKKWLHGDGLKNTLNDLEKFFLGKAFCRHWIAYCNDIPFAYLITSNVLKNSPEEDDLAQWCQEEGDAITLDLFICEPEFLGKKLSVPMIQEFLLQQFPNVTEVFIDPEATNTHAIYVYEKVGFRKIGEFIAKWHPVPHYRMRLSMKELIKEK